MSLSLQHLSQAIMDACRDLGHVYPDDAPPLLAHCTRHQKCQRYFFTKKLPLWRAQRHAFTYLFRVPLLDFNSMAQCLDTALEQGTAQITPGREHRRWDIRVILLCDRAYPDALERLEQYRHAAAYRLGLLGRMQVQAVAVDGATGELTHNRGGKALSGFVASVMTQE